MTCRKVGQCVTPIKPLPLLTMAFRSTALPPKGALLCGQRCGLGHEGISMRPQALFGKSEGQQKKQKASMGTPYGSLRLLLDSASVMQWERWSKSQLFYGKIRDLILRLCPVMDISARFHTYTGLATTGEPSETLKLQVSQQIPATF